MQEEIDAPPLEAPHHPGVTVRQVLRTWWPLAASWMLMGLELPVVSAVMARLPDPKISLAAYGGVVFPLSMIIEAPIIMLLSASTALAKDKASYRLLRRFMIGAGATLTLLHVLLAATPLYDLVVVRWIGVPVEIREPARLGLLIMIPWTWAIAYRRLQQGVLIRFGRSHLVGLGTAVRLGTNAAVLATGYLIGSLPGIVVGSTAVATGVVSEAVFAGFSVRNVLRQRLYTAPPVATPLTRKAFVAFYVPLAMTPLINLIVLPIGSAAVSRMPRALDSLACWPVLNGLTFTLRSLGIAYNEVVVAMLERPRAVRALRRFALGLGLATSSLLLLIAATPAARFYLGTLSALPESLLPLAASAAWILFPLPGLGVAQSWRQGILLHGRTTRAITEAVLVYLIVSGTIYAAGILYGRFTGLYVALFGAAVGSACQVAWLVRRSNPILASLRR